MKKAVFLLLLSPLYLFAQDKGIHFIHGLNWEQVLAKAKAEHKYIFIDCYTSWCLPCKTMRETVFPQEEAGEYFNQNFINVELQFDSTVQDNKEVSSWHHTALYMVAKYKILSYPTFMFMDENGEAVHRAMGFINAHGLVERAKTALNPDKRYYTLINQFKSGNRDTAFLYKLARVASGLGDFENANAAFTAYLATQTDLKNPRLLKLLPNLTQHSSDPGFAITLGHQEQVDALLGKGTAWSILQPIINIEEILPLLPFDLYQEPNWKNIILTVNKKYPTLTSEIIGKAQTEWYLKTKNWEQFYNKVQAYMKQYAADCTAFEKNDYARAVFEHCTDKSVITQALDWSLQSLSEIRMAALIDTYANLLYKSGQQKEAMEWEEKAIAGANEEDKIPLTATLEKMKKGIRTWAD